MGSSARGARSPPATSPTEACISRLPRGSPLCSPTPVKVAGLPNKVVQVVAGEEHTCALDDQRMAYCWGTNLYGELGNNQEDPYSLQAQLIPDPANLALPFYFDELAAGDVKTCGRQGTSWYCWGGGILGTQLADGSTPNGAVPQLVSFPP